MDLTGKAALITGGGRGIGRAVAEAYAQAGADIAICARTADELEDVAKSIRATGRNCAPAVCDVGDWDSVNDMVESVVAELGQLKVLVNNAGGGTERRTVVESDPHRWSDVVRVNLLGNYYVCRAVVPKMAASGGGTIINVGSGMGHQAKVGNSSYHAAKAGSWMLTRCLAAEVWEDGITVNELIPGPVATHLTSDLFREGETHPAFPSEWVKSPNDVVDLALFLANQPRLGPTGQSFSLARRPL